MKRVLALAALACAATVGCTTGAGPPALKHVVVNDEIHGGHITLTCIRWGTVHGSLQCDMTPLQPTPTVTVTVTARP